MKKYNTMLLLIIFCLSGNVFADHFSFSHSAAKLTSKDKETIKDTVSYMFENLHANENYGNNKCLNGAALIQQIDTNTNDENFYQQIQNVFYKYSDIHTTFQNPKPYLCKSYGISPNSLSFEIAKRKGEKKLVVSKVNYINAHYEQFIPMSNFNAGDVILSINGLEPFQALKSAAPYTFRQHPEAQEAASLKTFFYREGSYFRNIDIKNFQFVIERNRKIIIIIVPAVEYVDYDCLRDQSLKYSKYDSSNIVGPIMNTITVNNGWFYKDHFLYIKLPSFIAEVNGQDFLMSFLAQIKNSLNKNYYKGVLIDVRNNTGGSLSYADHLAKFFYHPKSGVPFYPISARVKANQNYLNIFQNLEDTAFHAGNLDLSNKYKLVKNLVIDSLNKRKPYSQTFSINDLSSGAQNLFSTLDGKQVIVLANAKCVSACDHFVALMKDQNLATKIIGESERTGGAGSSVNNLEFFENNEALSNASLFNLSMPYNIKVNFPWAQMISISNDGFRVLEQTGTKVDCVISKKVEEILNPVHAVIENQNYVLRILNNIDNESICEKSY